MSPKSNRRGRQISTAISKIEHPARLKILILGPSKKNGGDVYVKRCEIRKRVRALGHTADFCEDVWKPEILAATGLNLSVAEFLQARAYDYIVCLMASAGSIGEVHDFARDKRLAAKMTICVDRRHKRGYSAQGVLRIFEGLHGKIDWFKSPADIKRCHLASRVLDQIKKLAEGKQWEIATGGTPS